MQSTLKIHSFGPYGNVKDKLICQYIGVPLIKIHTCAYPTLWGDGNMSKGHTVSESPLPHQESWSPVVDESGNKNSVILTEIWVLYLVTQSILRLPPEALWRLLTLRPIWKLRLLLGIQESQITKVSRFPFLHLLIKNMYKIT